jgi:serine/threonine-protein kinase RsbW
MRIKVLLALPRDAASVPLVRHTVTAALRDAGVVEDCVAEVQVAVSEACTNAYHHASHGDGFEVLLEIGDDAITIDVTDEGSGFDPRAAVPTMPMPSAIGGRGLGLMTALTDTAVFDTGDGRGGSVHRSKRLRWAADAPFHHPASVHGVTDVRSARSRRGVRS